MTTSLGIYRWVNADGSSYDIDMDALPTTDLPPNVDTGVKLLINRNPASPDFGMVFRASTPNFRIEIDDATGETQLFHSTNYTDRSQMKYRPESRPQPEETA